MCSGSNCNKIQKLNAHLKFIPKFKTLTVQSIVDFMVLNMFETTKILNIRLRIVIKRV